MKMKFITRLDVKRDYDLLGERGRQGAKTDRQYKTQHKEKLIEINEQMINQWPEVIDKKNKTKKFTYL